MTRKILLPIAPEAEETQDVESLYSYLIRLAADHMVRLPNFFNRVIASEVPNAGRLFKSLEATDLCVITRPNHTTERLVEILGSVGFVGPERLARLTFLPLDPVLRRSQEAFEYELKWCPGCLAEQTAAGKPAYFKLVWNFTAVYVCISHKVALRRCCPHCGERPRPWSFWPDLAECQFCCGRLDNLTCADVSCDCVAAMAPDLVDLVGSLACSKAPFPEGGAYTYLHAIDAIGSALGLEKDWAPTTSELQELGASYWQRPSLLAVRRLAYRRNVPIEDILRGVPIVQSLPFEDEVLPRGLIPRARERRLDAQDLRRRFADVVEAPNTDALMSVRQIAERVGVSTGALHYHCPDLVKSYLSALAQRRAEIASVRARRAQEAVVAWLDAAGDIDRCNVSLKPLRNVLHAAGEFSKRELEAAVRAVVEAAQDKRDSRSA